MRQRSNYVYPSKSGCQKFSRIQNFLLVYIEESEKEIKLLQSQNELRNAPACISEVFFQWRLLHRIYSTLIKQVGGMKEAKYICIHLTASV